MIDLPRILGQSPSASEGACYVLAGARALTSAILSLRDFAVTEREDSEGGRDVGVSLPEGLVASIVPAAVGLLPRLQCLEQLSPPVVLLLGGVLEGILA